MNELENARKIINEVDREMAKLFEKRMLASEIVAAYKKEHALPILDNARENEVISKNAALLENRLNSFCGKAINCTLLRAQ